MTSRLTVVLVSKQLAIPALIFWLWLVFLPTTMAIVCPEECWCDSEKYSVSCPMSSFNSITLIHSKNVREFFFYGSSITSLKKDSFISKGLTDLEELYLSFCELETIELGAFNGLTKLTDLSLRYNKLSAIIPGTFEDLSNLEWLDLSYNNLRSVDVNILRALPKLSALYLSGNPLQCDCQLQELWRWCQDNNIQTVHEGTGPHCVIPSEGNSLPWMVLEELQCLQDNTINNVEYDYDGYKREEDENEQWYEIIVIFMEHIQLPLTAVLFIFGTTGNIIILIIIIRNKNMRTVPNMYIINLAISGLIHLTLYFSIICAYRITDTLELPWFLIAFIECCCQMTVGLLVAMLSFQRYRVTMNHVHVRVPSQSTWRAAVAELGVMWIVAAIFALPKRIIYFLIQKNVIFEGVTYLKYVALFELIVSCVFPLCVIVFSYIMTSRHLVESPRSTSERTEHPQMSAKVVLGLAVVFMFSYVPHYALQTYIVFNRGLISGRIYYKLFLYAVSNNLVLINPCLNPVALFCTSSLFRKYLKRYLTCSCKANSPPTDIQLTVTN